jgi:hypothetical protein
VGFWLVQFGISADRGTVDDLSKRRPDQLRVMEPRKEQLRSHLVFSDCFTDLIREFVEDLLVIR